MAPAFVLVLAVSGCGNQNPVMTPVGWWHDLQGGEIAATRPPPPGADLPYPKLGSIPPKPVLPSVSFRTTIATELAEQRDDQQRLAARNPIDTTAIPPPPPAAPPPAAADASTANATMPAAEASAPTAKSAPVAPPAAPGGPAPGGPVILAGAPADETNLPPIPEAPPAPASFEGVPAEPAPTPPPPLPQHTPPALAGSQVLFATGSAALDPSQDEMLKNAVAHRGKGHIAVAGNGDSQGDSPAAQEAGLTLGLQRAQIISARLEKMHVPPEAIVLSASPFGRGADVRAVP